MRKLRIHLSFSQLSYYNSFHCAVHASQEKIPYKDNPVLHVVLLQMRLFMSMLSSDVQARIAWKRQNLLAQDTQKNEIKTQRSPEVTHTLRLYVIIFSLSLKKPQIAGYGVRFLPLAPLSSFFTCFMTTIGAPGFLVLQKDLKG